MRKAIAYVLIGGALAGLSTTAAARPHIDVGISFGIPAPVYVGPRAPVGYYHSEAYGPPPVYVVPAPVYYAPYYYGPPVYRYGGHYHRHHHHHHHRGHGHRR